MPKRSREASDAAAVAKEFLKWLRGCDETEQRASLDSIAREFQAGMEDLAYEKWDEIVKTCRQHFPDLYAQLQEVQKVEHKRREPRQSLEQDLKVILPHLKRGSPEKVTAKAILDALDWTSSGFWRGPLVISRDRDASLVIPTPSSKPMSVARSVQLLFQLCGTRKDRNLFTLSIGEGRIGLRYSAKGDTDNGVLLLPPREPDTKLLHQGARDRLEEWLWDQIEPDLQIIDDTLWDVATTALILFYERTDGERVEARFNFWIEDYFEWLEVAASHRLFDRRHQVFRRLDLLASKRLQIINTCTLLAPNATTGRKSLQESRKNGPFLSHVADLCLRSDRGRGGKMKMHPDGLTVSLGDWAKEIVSRSAFVGRAVRQLSKYNAYDELWERRIGWYVVLQLHNQAIKSQWESKGGDLKMVRAQHPLVLETILRGACLDWEAVAKKRAGRVLERVSDAVKRLEADGIVSLRALDGPIDGSDLTGYGVLAKVLKRRFEPLPGPLLEGHLAKKARVSRDAKEAADRARKARQKKG